MLGIGTHRELLQRIDEVNRSRAQETKKAMRLYAHFKHRCVCPRPGGWQSVPPLTVHLCSCRGSVTARTLDVATLSACFTREVGVPQVTARTWRFDTRSQQPAGDCHAS